MPEPFRMVVELGKAREFAAAVGHPEPVHDGSPVPLTFLHSMRFWAGPASRVWSVDHDFSGTLDGQQEFVFHGGPIRVGEELVGHSRIDRVYEKHGKSGPMQFTDVVTEFRSPGGTLRAEVRGVLITPTKAHT